MRMKRICFYHSADLDGHCSGAIVRRSFGRDVELIGIDYDHEFPWEKIDLETRVWMVDFSLEPIEDMVRLENECAELYWVDHHKTAIEEAARVEFTCPGLRVIGRAGCELTWEVLRPGEHTPEAVTLLGRYDVWDLDYSKDVLPFQYGMRLYGETRPETDFGEALWFGLLGVDAVKNPVQRIIHDGRMCLGYERSTNVKLMRTCSFEVELDGLRVVAANVPMGSSQKFESVWDAEKHDAMCAFYRKGRGKWVVSLYSDKEDVDVSAVCLARGGGGHKGAAGFSCEELPRVLR
jgi:oligoribonuclease NrnB/cAMP/cGMP phosphodiesterase (DHH superfamily)